VGIEPQVQVLIFCARTRSSPARLSAEYFLRPEQSRDRLGVGDLSLAYPASGRGERSVKTSRNSSSSSLRVLVFELFREVDLDRSFEYAIAMLIVATWPPRQRPYSRSPP